jgi:hypothetical protein
MSHYTSASPDAARWMMVSFVAALALSAAVLVLQGPGEHGIHTALFLTGRLNFLLFWPAYAGGALASLLGRALAPIRRYGRVLGLGFATALAVHLGLVAWLCAIGAAPGLSTFLLFGIAAAFAYLIALFSIARLQRALGATGWRLLTGIGMNVIAYAFAVDFLDGPLSGGAAHVALYLPFAILSVVGPALRLAAFVYRLAGSSGFPRSA